MNQPDNHQRILNETGIHKVRIEASVEQLESPVPGLNLRDYEAAMNTLGRIRKN